MDRTRRDQVREAELRCDRLKMQSMFFLGLTLFCWGAAIIAFAFRFDLGFIPLGLIVVGIIATSMQHKIWYDYRRAERMLSSLRYPYATEK